MKSQIGKFRLGLIKFAMLLPVSLVFVACASKFLKYEHAEQLKKNDEFEKSVKIDKTPMAEEIAPSPMIEKDMKILSDVKPPLPSGKKAKKKSRSKTAPKLDSSAPPAKEEVPAVVEPQRRQPEIESDIGFQGRRPLQDPFRVGERVTHKVRYLQMNAGFINFEVLPFVSVNGRKSYNFKTSIGTSSLFSSFYAVNDNSETLVDFENLVPSVFTLHVEETGQIKEASSFFDHASSKATFWEKKVTEKNGKEERRLEWEIAPYSQNVFSAVYYMRNFQWEVGSENSFPVSDDGKNLIFKAKAIRKEKLSTDAGEFDAVVIKPEVILQGKFQPVGDIFIWLSDDANKYILRIEAKIKIGSMVSEVTEIVKSTKAESSDMKSSSSPGL